MSEATKDYSKLPTVSPLGAPLDWAWLRGAKSEWGVRPKPSPRGLTMLDIAVGSYGEVPEHPTHRSMAPRGADIEPGTPDMGYILNDKADVWADNTRELYEEAVARQWSATRDIPWGELQELDDDVEHAMCQLCTLLTEVEMIAADLPAKWMWRMNHEFIEAKMFLCTQMMDEARHAEVFRKRALANGGGLLLSRNGATSLLRTIIEAKSYTQATALMHLLGEGFVLDLFRMGELIAPSDVEKRIFRMCMQDEARHVAYGTMHIRYSVEHDPDVAEEIHEALDHGEMVLTEFGTAPDVSTALAVLLAGGVEHVEDKGFPLSLEMTKKQFSSYLARCERAGISRLERTKIPLDLLGIDIEAIRSAREGGMKIDTHRVLLGARGRDERASRAVPAARRGRHGRRDRDAGRDAAAVRRAARVRGHPLRARGGGRARQSVRVPPRRPTRRVAGDVRRHRGARPRDRAADDQQSGAARRRHRAGRDRPDGPRQVLAVQPDAAGVLRRCEQAARVGGRAMSVPNCPNCGKPDHACARRALRLVGVARRCAT